MLIGMDTFEKRGRKQVEQKEKLNCNADPTKPLPTGPRALK